MKHLILSLALLMGIAASGQTIDIEQQYGITWRDTLQLKARYTYAQAKTKYPAWVGYMEWKGASSKVLNYYEGEVAIQNSLWANDNGIGKTHYPDGLQSRANIILPHLEIKVSDIGYHGFGTMWGQGTALYNQAQYQQSSGGTTFKIDRANWNGTPGVYGVFQSPLYGVEGTYSYSESFRLINFRIIGGGREGSLYDSSINEVGVRVWRAGELSKLESLFISHCNDFGIEFAGGNHATAVVDMVSSFCHALGGFGITGGGKVSAYMPSSDDCPAQWVIRPTDTGSIGNGTILTVFDAKLETGQATGRPISKGMALLDAEGLVNATFYSPSYSRVNSIPECMVRIKNTTDQVCKVSIYGFNDFYLPKTILHDRNSKVRYQFPGGLFATDITRIEWNSKAGMISNGAFETLTNTCDARLAPLGRNANTGQAIGTWNYTTCTPAYSWTAPMIASEGGTTTNPPVDPVDPPPGPVDPPPGPVDPPPPTAKPYTVTTNIAQHSAYEGIAAAVDGNLSTRWTSGRYPTVNDWITIDMGADARWKTITLDATGSAADFLSGLQVSVSSNGTSWSKLTTSTAANATVNAVYGVVTRLTSSTWRTNRYIRIQPTVVGSKWWSIHEITVE